MKYDSICEVHCTDNDKTVTAEVMNFRENDNLTIVLATNKIIMKWNGKVYVGNTMGMEFTSKGPKTYNVREGRQR